MLGIYPIDQNDANQVILPHFLLYLTTHIPTSLSDASELVGLHILATLAFIPLNYVDVVQPGPYVAKRTVHTIVDRKSSTAERV